MLTLKEAIGRIESMVVPVGGCELQPLHAALGRVVSEDLIAERDVPGYANAAVDGYGVAGAVDSGGYDIGAEVKAGDTPPQRIGQGQAVRLFTGAPIPRTSSGALLVDRMALEEEVRAEDGRVWLPALETGANIRAHDDDVAARALLVRQGTRLGPAELGLCAAQGWAQMPVVPVLRCAVFSTGNELVSPTPAVSSALPLGKIFDSNTTTITAMLQGWGGQVVKTEALCDDKAAIMAQLASTDQDMVIVSGGMSLGAEDHVSAAIRALGTLDIWWVGIKPGRPFGFGMMGKTPILGLPGNPAAVFTTMAFLGRIAVHRRMGARARPLGSPARLGVAVRKKAGRVECLRVRCTQRSGERVLEPYGKRGAGILSSLAGCDGFAVLEEERVLYRKGGRCEFVSMAEVLG